MNKTFALGITLGAAGALSGALLMGGVTPVAATDIVLPVAVDAVQGHDAVLCLRQQMTPDGGQVYLANGDVCVLGDPAKADGVLVAAVSTCKDVTRDVTKQVDQATKDGVRSLRKYLVSQSGLTPVQ